MDSGAAGATAGTFYRWVERYGRANTHNGLMPRDHWLTETERQAILRYHAAHPTDGYRRMTFQMLDADVVAVSPATVYRVLKTAGVLDQWNGKPSKKGTGGDSQDDHGGAPGSGCGVLVADGIEVDDD